LKTGAEAVRVEGLERDLHELVALSQAAGRRRDWVQAAGGNSSLKREAEGLLLVKASGLRLDECTPTRGFVGLDLRSVRRVLAEGVQPGLSHAAQQDAAGDILLKALRPVPGLDAAGLRPSLEAEFHALGARICLHVHLVEGLAALCQEDAQGELAAALDLPYVWADYRPPGHSLACLVDEALRERSADVAAMGNHGLVVWGPDAKTVLATVERLQHSLGAHFKAVEPPPLHAKPKERREALAAAARAARAAWPHLAEAREATDPWVLTLAQGGAWTWQPVCPDDVIYAGLDVPTLEAGQASDPGRLKGLLGEPAAVAVLALEDHGVLIAARDARAWRFAHEILYANARARALARTRGTVRPLRRDQCLELLGMKGEKYRQDLKG
jgi:rhamnose utilization protein RhaD (predicted bifunctional aldolase and dehydrogenase)